MINLRGCLFFIWAISLCASASSTTDRVYKSYWQPTLRGERLDYCTYDHQSCGKKVANRYCKLMGYDYASQNTKANNVGLTHYLDTRLKCQGWQCNGFMDIACAKHFKHKPPQAYHYRKKRFVFPRYNQYRVDWCYKEGKGCGAKAAHAFCSRVGYMKAQSFKKEEQVPATKALGDDALCFSEQCQAFKVIICSR